MASIQLLLLYGLIFGSGWQMTQNLRLPTPLLRAVMTFTLGCGQLLITIQGLSLFHRLDGGWLLGVNAVLTAGIVLGIRLTGRQRYSPGELDRISSREAGRLSPTEKSMLGIAALAVVIAVTTGFFVCPAADPYHFTMVLFWRQHHSILPYAGPDPRSLGVVFAAEALVFPTILYAQSWAGFAFLSVSALGFAVWLVAALSRSLGAATGPAWLAGGLMAVAAPFISSVYGFNAEILLSVMWTLATVLCLFEAHRSPVSATRLLGCAVLCFTMACGAKNVVLLHAPFVAAAALLIFGRALFTPRRIAVLVAAGLAGLAASGVAWSYAANRLWFGSWRGHPFLGETLAQDFGVAAVWTRWCRGLVMLLFDPGWLPPAWRAAYADFCMSSIALLGGQTRLAEDDGFYSLTAGDWKGGLGIGPVALVIVLPALILAAHRAWSRGAASASAERARLRALWLLGVGSTLLFYTMLRTQSIGVTRLMGTNVALWMPFCALLLDRTFFRALGFGVAAWSLLFTFATQAGFTTRRLDLWPGSSIRQMISSFHRTQPAVAEVLMPGSAPMSVTFLEPSSRREAYQILFRRIRQPATLGVVAGYNAELFLCFGPGFANTVVPLNDCRDGRLIEMPPSVEYVVVDDYDASRLPVEFLRNCVPILTIRLAGGDVLRCYRHEKSNLSRVTF